MHFGLPALSFFFSFFRKSNLLIQSLESFDLSKHLCAHDVEFTPEGVILSVRQSEVIQYRERILHTPLPKIKNFPFCPSTSLLGLTTECPAAGTPVPLFRFLAPDGSL